MKGNVMSSGPVENWNDLTGRVVQIRKDGRVVRSGHVEAVTPAADILWLAIHGADPRALFEKAEGYTVWPATGQPRVAGLAGEPMTTNTRQESRP